MGRRGRDTRAGSGRPVKARRGGAPREIRSPHIETRDEPMAKSRIPCPLEEIPRQRPRARTKADTGGWEERSRAIRATMVKGTRHNRPVAEEKGPPQRSGSAEEGGSPGGHSEKAQATVYQNTGLCQAAKAKYRSLAPAGAGRSRGSVSLWRSGEPKPR